MGLVLFENELQREKNKTTQRFRTRLCFMKTINFKVNNNQLKYFIGFFLHFNTTIESCYYLECRTTTEKTVTGITGKVG